MTPTVLSTLTDPARRPRRQHGVWKREPRSRFACLWCVTRDGSSPSMIPFTSSHSTSNSTCGDFSMMPLCAPIADVMMSRGIEDPEQFLAPSKWSDMPSPLQIQGMRAAVDRILLAVRLKQRVVVFGDYDCDG